MIYHGNPGALPIMARQTGVLSKINDYVDTT